MKKFLICALIAVFALCVAGCDGTPDVTHNGSPSEAPIETPAETPTEESTETPTEESTEAPTEDVTEEATEDVTEEATEEATEDVTEAPADSVEPTACFTAEQLASLSATNATVTLEGDYAHFLTGITDTQTNPSITLTAEGDGFSDIISIKYRTNCGGYGSNFWGTLVLDGTATFNGNRIDSDNWFYYATDGTWNVLILDMRKNKAGSQGVPDTDVTGGAAIQSMVYNLFDYTGNLGKLATADGGEEYFDVEYIAFFESKADAEAFANRSAE